MLDTHNNNLIIDLSEEEEDVIGSALSLKVVPALSTCRHVTII